MLFLQCFLESAHPPLISWAQMVLLVFLKLIGDSWSVKISNTASKPTAQVLLESAVSAQNPSLWLHSRRQKPTASFLQHRSQFPSIWGLKRCLHSSVWALCAPIECCECSRSSTAWFKLHKHAACSNSTQAHTRGAEVSLEQSQPRMHQAPLHTHKVLESSHPCCWGTISISFYAGESKRPANYWCQRSQGKQDKVWAESSIRSHSKASDEFNSSPFYLYNHTRQEQPISSGHQEATALLPVSAGETIVSHTQTPIPDWPFLVFLFAPDTSTQPRS